jgi:hypothetical protein
MAVPCDFKVPRGLRERDTRHDRAISLGWRPLGSALMPAPSSSPRTAVEPANKGQGTSSGFMSPADATRRAAWGL